MGIYDPGLNPIACLTARYPCQGTRDFAVQMETEIPSIDASAASFHSAIRDFVVSNFTGYLPEDPCIAFDRATKLFTLDSEDWLEGSQVLFATADRLCKIASELDYTSGKTSQIVDAIAFRNGDYMRKFLGEAGK